MLLFPTDLTVIGSDLCNVLHENYVMPCVIGTRVSPVTATVRLIYLHMTYNAMTRPRHSARTGLNDGMTAAGGELGDQGMTAAGGELGDQGMTAAGGELGDQGMTAAGGELGDQA